MDIFVMLSKASVNINETNRNTFNKRVLGEETINMNVNRQYDNSHFICSHSRLLRNHNLKTEEEFDLQLKKQTSKNLS